MFRKHLGWYIEQAPWPNDPLERRSAKARLCRLETPLEVSELLPPAARCPVPSDEHLECFETALDAFLEGQWSAAFELLHRIPAQDVAADFLTVYIAQHNRVPPSDWDGVIGLGTK